MWAPDTHSLFANQETWINAFDTLLRIESFNALKAFMHQELRQIIPHHAMFCGVGRMQGNTLTDPSLLLLDFPIQYLWDVANDAGGLACPIMQSWIKTKRVQLFDSRLHSTEVDASWLECFKCYGLRNIVAHGIHDVESQVTSYFAFCRIPHLDMSYYRQALRLMVPQLHSALLPWVNRLEPLPQKLVPPPQSISFRERTVLSWLAEGKSNEQIGALLGVTENTAKTHVRNIFRKLGVRHRAQVRIKMAPIRPFMSEQG